MEDLTTDDLEIVDPEQFKLYEVDKDCELGYFMARCGLHYNRIGSVYYEFVRKQEIITEDKDIILMKSKVMPSMSLIGPNITACSYCGYHCYTIHNKNYFQKVSFCVITQLIGQNGRAKCKKHGNHGDARGDKRLVLALGTVGWPTIARIALEYSLWAWTG